jgi:hypothetical protein
MMHPTISDNVLNLARHELGHAVFAHAFGYYVESIALGHSKGCTVWQHAVTPASFPLAYEQSAIRASVAAVQTVSIIRVGRYVELHGGQHGYAPCGQDLVDFEAWRQCLTAMGGAEWWARVYSESLRGLQTWYRHASVQRSIAAMAPTLVHNRTLSRWGMLSLFEAGGVANIPEPVFRPVLAPATPQRQSTHGVPGVHHAARAVAIAALKNGDFAKPPSAAELAALNQIGEELRRGVHIPELA